MQDLWCQLLHDLQALSLAYQVAHWRTRGATYFSDHQFFQRLYTETSAEIDPVAEKMVGLLGSNLRMDPGTLAKGTLVSLTALRGNGTSLPANFPASMLEAERVFLRRVDSLIEALRGMGHMTQGVENLLQGIADLHESHVYLLQQRSS